MTQFSLANFLQNTANNPMPAANPAQTPVATQAPTALWQQSLNAFTDPNSQMMQQAAQRGKEYAAQRGGLNSTIAAGAAQREQLNAAGQFAAGAAQMGHDSFMAERNAQMQDWMADQGLRREFAAALTMMPISNSMDMLRSIQQFAMSDPALYPPEVISGMSNFFTQNMNDIISQYFANMMGGN